MSAAPQFAIRSTRPAHRRELVSKLIADQAVLGLLHELAVWPKPGLVSHVDSGSHTDMDAAMVQDSAESLRPFFAELARVGQDGADMGRLRTIGLRAEAAMLAVTGGINTHRGAIFGLGLLCAAAGEVAEISADGAAVAPARLGDVLVVDVADPARQIAERHDGEDRHQGVEQSITGGRSRSPAHQRTGSWPECRRSPRG